jgi:4-amino-4-deoxy-L-arabinose transferase-like glycosyltransferase
MNRHILLLAGILVLGIWLRFFQLGEIPLGRYWDEAVITYDAWGIADWHRDQFADFMPMVFESFGDNKPPVMHYLLASIFLVTGVNDSTIRVISAISGVLLILVMYYWGRYFFSYPSVGILAAFITSVSPWMVHVSRIGFEANLALLFSTIGIMILTLELRHKWWYGLGILLLAVSMYTYHSSKIVAPLFFIISQFWLWKLRVLNLKQVLIGVVIFCLASLPLILTVNQGSLGRGQSTLVFLDDQGKLDLTGRTIAQITENISKHLTLDFLIRGKQPTMRNIVPGFGIVYVLDILLILLGAWFMWVKNRRRLFLLTLLILAGLIPSIVSNDSPHTIRVLTIFPMLGLCIAYGMYQGFDWLKHKWGVKNFKYFMFIFFSVYAGLIIRFVYFYLSEYSTVSAIDFQYGYKEAFLTAKNELKTAKELVVTDAYGQPYVYTLLYFGYTPEQYTQGVLANVKFMPIIWPTQEKNVVYVATPDEISPSDPAVIEVISVPGTDTPVFIVART